MSCGSARDGNAVNKVLKGGSTEPLTAEADRLAKLLEKEVAPGELPLSQEAFGQLDRFLNPEKGA